MAQKPTKNGLVLTSLYVLPGLYGQFQNIARAEGTTATHKIREFILRECRRAEKAAAK
jgi:hypothetical protein